MWVQLFLEIIREWKNHRCIFLLKKYAESRESKYKNRDMMIALNNLEELIENIHYLKTIIYLHVN